MVKFDSVPRKENYAVIKNHKDSLVTSVSGHMINIKKGKQESN